MTARAKRAAEELLRRGWQLDGPDDVPLDKACTRCGYQMPHDARYCQQCGARAQVVVSESCIADLEAAIAQANWEQP